MGTKAFAQRVNGAGPEAAALFGIVLALSLAPALAMRAEAQAGEGSLAFGGSLSARAWAAVTAPEAAVDGGAQADSSTTWTAGASALASLDLAARGPSGPAGASARLSLDVAESPASLVPGLALRAAWVRLDWGWASLALGRQPLPYGRAPLWSSVDLYSVIDYSALLPRKFGPDALRLRLPFGQTGMADFVAALPPLASARGLDPACLRASARVSTLALPGLDLAALVQRDGSAAELATSGEAKAAWRLGGDFKLDLGPSLYGEALWSVPESAMDAGDWGEGRFRVTAGGDWSLGDLVMAAEYYWNGGVEAILDPWKAAEHNLYASIAYRGIEYLDLSAIGTWAPEEGTGGLTALASLDAAQGAALSLYLQAAHSRVGDAMFWAGNLGCMLEFKF